MNYKKLGNTDLRVSDICLGCMGFGDASKGMHTWTLPYVQSEEIIVHALNQGINFFDTAMGYQGGTSEMFLGKAIKAHARREDVVIATKFVPMPKEKKVSLTTKQYIRECLMNSLERLDMDYVDLYYLHMWDYHTPIEEILEALHELIQEGKIRYIGISNCYAYQLAKANELAKAHGWETFSVVQGHYNLIFREEEREMKKYCEEEGIAMAPYSALASGRLAKRPEEISLRLKEDQYAKGKYEATQEQDAKIIARVMALADQKQVSMSEIALAWLINKGTTPIAGATRCSHIDTASKSSLIKLSEKEVHDLEELYVPHDLVGVMKDNHA